MVALSVSSIPSGLSNGLPAYGVDSASTRRHVTMAIQTAAAKTGVNFDYLLSKATQESDCNPNAKASTSSATGLFQFTSQTWLRLMKKHGAACGLGGYADQIQLGHNGQAQVSNPALRHEILQLRHDPKISAEMACALDQENNATLKANLGGKIGSTELYLAHFLGAGGAVRFLQALRSDPSAKAADLLPKAAGANQSVFYDSNGDAKSVGQIYQSFARKFDHIPATGAGTMIANTPALLHTARTKHASPSALTALTDARTLMPGTPVHAIAKIELNKTEKTGTSGMTQSSSTAMLMPSKTETTSTVQHLADTSSSLFTTMILAQIDSQDLTSIALSRLDNTRHRKNTSPDMQG